MPCIDEPAGSWQLAEVELASARHHRVSGSHDDLPIAGSVVIFSHLRVRSASSEELVTPRDGPLENDLAVAGS
jgi:hypothetical protein